jgi:hypothetical protein
MSRCVRIILGLGAGALLAFIVGLSPVVAQQKDDGPHLGVATCAGDNCHGSVHRLPGARVAQDEYLIWKNKDKHSKAFAVLKEERGVRIARNLGLPDAENAPICLTCHTDDVPPARRGPRFQLADGVGCEACHGGAIGWLGIHISGGDHPTNIAAGLYPTDEPLPRAERCLNCHIGDDPNAANDPKRSITHVIMGAGHPPMPFELDTYTAIQPAHFHVDASYAARRKPIPNDMQMWLVGQAVDLRKHMDLLLDPGNAPKGANPELYLFDCQACHHAMNQLQWHPRPAIGLGPGRLRLYDANTVMLHVAAARVAPDAATSLSTHMKALHQATVAATPDYWSAVKREATAVRQDADTLIKVMVNHQFDKADAKALAEAVIALGVDGTDLDYSAAQQATWALRSIVAAMKLLKFADEQQTKALDDALGPVFDAIANDQTYRPDAFVQALRQVQAKLP